MEKLINGIHAHAKIIIASLIVVVILLMLVIRFFPKKTTTSQQQTDTSTPSIHQEMPTYAPYPTIPPPLLPELEYPVIYNTITVEFKPKSGTFLIYYDKDEGAAKRDFAAYIDTLGLPKDQYRVEYRSLELITLPPAYQKNTE